MGGRSFVGSLAAGLVLAACGGSGDLAETTTSAVSTATTTTTVAVGTTTVPGPTETSAGDTGPIPVDIDGRCNVGVFREDESGTTWLMDCGLDTVGEDQSLRNLGYSAHFRYLVDENQTRTGVLFEVLAIRTPTCPWTPEESPLEVPIVGDQVAHAIVLHGGETCDGMTVTAQTTWDLEAGTILIQGELEAHE